MPEMGGGETYDRLKVINPEIKVLLSTGYSMNGQATDILKRGCDGFIQKPFNMEELSQKIRSVLDSWESWDKINSNFTYLSNFPIHYKYNIALNGDLKPIKL